MCSSVEPIGSMNTSAHRCWSRIQQYVNNLALALDHILLELRIMYKTYCCASALLLQTFVSNMLKTLLMFRYIHNNKTWYRIIWYDSNFFAISKKTLFSVKH